VVRQVPLAALRPIFRNSSQSVTPKTSAYLRPHKRVRLGRAPNVHDARQPCLTQGLPIHGRLRPGKASLDFRKPRRARDVPTSHPTDIQDEQVGTHERQASRKPAALPTVGAALGSASESPWDVEAGLPPAPASPSHWPDSTQANPGSQARSARISWRGHRKSAAHHESRQETLKVWSSARRTKVQTCPEGHWRTGTAERPRLGKAHESPNLPRRADGDEPEPTTRPTRAEAPTHAWDASTTPDRR